MYLNEYFFKITWRCLYWRLERISNTSNSFAINQSSVNYEKRTRKKK